MNNREAKRRRQRAKAKPAQRVRMVRANYVEGGTAKGAAAHAAWRASNAAQCSLDGWTNERYFGDAKHYQSPIHEVNVAPTQLWLDERSGQRTARTVRLEDV